MSQDLPNPSASSEIRWEDRRSTPRHKTDVEVLWYLTAEKPIKRNQGRMVDLSISGAALRTAVQLSAGDPISLKLPPKDKKQSTAADGSPLPVRSSHSLSVRGIVVNVCQLEGGDWRYGIKFERLYYTLAEWASS